MEKKTLSIEELNNIHEKIENLYRNNKELFKESVYYDYLDEIDTKDIVKCKDIYELEDKYIEIIDDSGVIWELEDHILNNVLEKLELNIEDYENGYNLEDLIRDYIEIDYNLDDLFSRSEFHVNLMPYQQENANCEGSELNYDLQEIIENINEGKTITKDDEFRSESLKKLFYSQGYKISDLIDDKKVDNSKFLKSFIEELNNFYEEFPSFLVFLTDLGIDDYYALKSGEKDLIFEKGMCGLFNPVTGSGSILEIELEKPFTISFEKDDYFNLIQVDGFSEYGYSVNEVYGLISSAWTDSKITMEDRSKDPIIKEKDKGKLR